MGGEEKEVAGGEGVFAAGGTPADDGDEGEVAGGAEVLWCGEDFFLHAEVFALGDGARLDVRQRGSDVVEVGREH